jgi:hypothetical protein
MNVPEHDLPRLLAGRSGKSYATFLTPGEIPGDRSGTHRHGGRVASG